MKLKCGSMPNVTATRPNTGGASVECYWAAERRRCSEEAKMRNPLNFAGVPQTRQPISAINGRKFTILWWHVEETLLFKKFCFWLSIHALVAKYIAQQSCAMVRRWRIFACSISASRMQHISQLHSKFAQRPHHVWKYGRHPIWDRWE